MGCAWTERRCSVGCVLQSWHDEATILRLEGIHEALHGLRHLPADRVHRAGPVEREDSHVAATLEEDHRRRGHAVRWVLRDGRLG